MPNVVLVMIGGAVGAAARYEVGRVSVRLLGGSFPWGTLIVNLVGGLLMGLLASLIVRDGVQEPVYLLLGVGVLGGFTTFSAFSLDMFVLIERGGLAPALAYAAASVGGSILLLLLGVWLGRSIA